MNSEYGKPMKFFKKLKEYNRIADFAEIARRYFAINSFDGIMTILGVLLGNFVSSVENPSIIIATGVSTSIAMAISGLWGSYMAEEAERKRKIHELGKQTLTKNLHKSKIGKAGKIAAFAISLVNGLAPSVTAIIVLIPFFFTSVISVTEAYYFSIGVASTLLFGLGMFLGAVSKEHILVNGVKMLLIGLLTIGIIFFLGS